MTARPRAGIYLIVSFNWPQNVTKEMAAGARRLHDAVMSSDWIRETLAASGGLGSSPSSVWIFWLQDYSVLNRLLHDEKDPVSQAYLAFFPNMLDVDESIREQVVFL